MKLNNKGFAISTIVYGIMIMFLVIVSVMMAIMSTNIKNNDDFVNNIEEELNKYSNNSYTFLPMVNASGIPITQEYNINQTGWYKIELWGSQGYSGYGAYTSGIVELRENETLYFFVGKKRGYNNSGLETDVRVVNGSYTDLTSIKSRIMVASGGGRNSGSHGGSLIGYSYSMSSDGANLNDSTLNLTSGTLIGNKSNYMISSLVQPPKNTTSFSISATNSGGDGYYPSNDPGVGGISFIAGYGGSRAFKSEECKAGKVFAMQAVTSQPTMCNEQRYYIFYNGMMIPGAKDGDGKARIELLVPKSEHNTLPKKNNKFNTPIQYIRACISSSNANATQIRNDMNIAAISSGVDVAKDKNVTVTDSDISGQLCKTFKLKQTYNLDEIVVWHKKNKAGGIDIINNSIYVSTNGSSYQTIKDVSKLNGSTLNIPAETETPTGTRVNAYQYDSTGQLPNYGEYYIMPITSENKVITAGASASEESNPISLKTLNSGRNQIWKIERIDPSISGGTQYYKIEDITRHKALSTSSGTTNIYANSIFNNESTKMWYIRPITDGTYTITNKASNTSLIGKKATITTRNSTSINYTTQRFKIIDVSYSTQ